MSGYFLCLTSLGINKISVGVCPMITLSCVKLMARYFGFMYILLLWVCVLDYLIAYWCAGPELS